MSGLEENDEICIEVVEFACRIQKLSFYLIVFCFKKINVVAAFHTHPTDGSSKKLRGRITDERHFYTW